MLAWLGSLVTVLGALALGILIGMVFGEAIKGLFQKKV
jgi:hypothetical protein